MKHIFLFSVFTFIIQYAFAQGCSDAGVCTLDAYGSNDQKFRSFFSLGSTYEIGENDAIIVSPQMRLNYLISDHWSVQAKIPYWLSNHPSGNVKSFSDPIISLKYSFESTTKSSIFLGTRLGTNASDFQGDNGFSLPMASQSSLGTIDILGGFSAIFKNRIKTSAAIQIPVSQFNENKHVVSKYISGYDTLSIADQDQYRFIRRSDLMLRFDYFIPFDHFSLHLGLLPVIHLSDDIIEQNSGEKTDHIISGSQGLTLNIPFGASIPISDRLNLEIDGGFPIITRKERPDGLTRSFVLFLNLKYGFN